MGPEKQDLIGKKFGRLLVIHSSKPRHGRAYWVCECNCGRMCSAAGKALRSGKKKSCGCLRKEMARSRQPALSEGNRLESGESGFNLLYATYRCGAEYRGHSFDLSKDDFRKITSEKCVYCGDDPHQKTGNELSGFYIYNGIDRKNNTIGYTLENSASCCGRCNLMKGKQSVDEFIAACRSVVKHFAVQ